jgi:hypothetical protein
MNTRLIGPRRPAAGSVVIAMALLVSACGDKGGDAADAGKKGATAKPARPPTRRP